MQLDNSCDLQVDTTGGGHDSSIPVTNMLRLIAAAALFLEGVCGVYIPVLLRSLEGFEW